LESTDGATYNQLKEIDNPSLMPNEDELSEQHNVPSLAEQLAARKAEEEEEFRQRHRNLPPKPLDEEEVFFLEALEKEDQIKQDLKQKQEQEDIDSFNEALKNRVIKLSDADKIQSIQQQINGNLSEKIKEDDKNLVIAPSVHESNDKPKVDLNGIILLKKVKKVKKKKKNNKNKKKEKEKSKNGKKRKLDELETESEKRTESNLDQNEERTKRRKLTNLSEWECD